MDNAFKSLQLLEHLLVPDMGVSALHPRIYGYGESILARNSVYIQEDNVGIYLKISEAED